MTPRLTAAAAGLFGFGCWVGYRVHLRVCEETHIRMYRRLLVAEANTQVVGEAERITREGTVTPTTRLLTNANGTHQYGAPGTEGEDRRPRGPAQPPPLPAWMADPRRKCRDKPTAWWYAPEWEAIEELDEHGRIVLDDEGKAVIADRIQISTEVDSALAEALCGRCPLNLECREYGLRNERHGRWGGVKVDPLNATRRRDLLAGVDRERRRRSA